MRIRRPPDVELIYDTDCPNVEAARAQLRAALARLGLPACWRECDRGDRSGPAYAARYGSPTILVGGKDVTGAAPAGGPDCCRIYPDEAGRIRGVPPIGTIVAALEGRASPDQARRKE